MALDLEERDAIFTEGREKKQLINTKYKSYRNSWTTII